jgi:AhpD family alkylhydroperoxidase
MMLDARIDQENLLKSILQNTPGLDKESIIFSAWAAVYTVQSTHVENLVESWIGKPTQEQKRAILFSVARMGVTNPYFVSRQYLDLNAGGTLEALNFRSFGDIKVANEAAYHFACIAVSVINGGHMCLRSHAMSLLNAGATDENIDAVMRLGAVCHSLAKLEFSFDKDEQ